MTYPHRPIFSRSHSLRRMELGGYSPLQELDRQNCRHAGRPPIALDDLAARPYMPMLKRQKSRLSCDRVTAVGGMSSRSIRSSRRRAARER